MSVGTDVLIVSSLATVRAGLAAVLAATGDLRVVGHAIALEGGAAEPLPDVEVVLLDAPSAAEIDDAVLALEGLGPGLVLL